MSGNGEEGVESGGKNARRATDLGVLSGCEAPAGQGIEQPLACAGARHAKGVLGILWQQLQRGVEAVCLPEETGHWGLGGLLTQGLQGPIR